MGKKEMIVNTPPTKRAAHHERECASILPRGKLASARHSKEASKRNKRGLVLRVSLAPPGRATTYQRRQRRPAHPQWFSESKSPCLLFTSGEPERNEKKQSKQSCNCLWHKLPDSIKPHSLPPPSCKPLCSASHWRDLSSL